MRRLRSAESSAAIAVVALTGLLTFGAAGLAQQQTTRRSTNLASLLNYPAFFQLRPVLVVGTLSLENSGRVKLTDETGSVSIVSRGNQPDGLVEVRGEFWDIGRMNQDDPRLLNVDVRRTFGIDPEAPWPRPGQVLAICASAIAPATSPSLPTLRNLVLFPSRYRDQKVTLVGQFAGRNLLGDLPDAPARSRYDFVLRSADAALWVTNIRPRGRDFELVLDARIDTGRWLEVTGTLQQGRGLQWIDGDPKDQNAVRLAKPPADEPETVIVSAPPAPPPEVIFSAPTGGESDVALTTLVRIQFSRDLDPATVKGRLRVQYFDEKPDAARPITQFTTEYRAAARVLEVKFNAPLEPFQKVRVSFDEGVLGVDKQPLKPWTLQFELAGR